MMRTTRALVCVAAVLAMGVAAVPSAAAAGKGNGGRPFRVALSGANEFNAQGVPINPHGNADRGSITLRLNPGQKRICWSAGALTLTAGEALPSAGHIHEAPRGVAGPVVVDLFAGAAPTSYPTGTRCVSADRRLIIDIIRDPSDYYVNFHNAQHPGGVVRGQLR